MQSPLESVAIFGTHASTTYANSHRIGRWCIRYAFALKFGADFRAALVFMTSFIFSLLSFAR